MLRAWWHTPPLALWPVRLCLLLAMLAAVPLSLLPLTALPGVESAWILALLLTPLAGSGTVAIVAHAQARPSAGSATSPDTVVETPPIWPRLGRHLALFALLLWTLPGLCLALNAWRLTWCQPLLSLAFYALGPGLSIVFASSAAAAITLWLPGRRKLAAALTLLWPLLSYCGAVWRFWAGPGIFLYGHAWGYFPGAFYDRSLDFPPALLWFRLESGCWILCFGALAAAVLAPSRRRWLCWALLPASAALFLLGLGCELDTRSSRTALTKTLSTQARGRHCTVHAPAGTGQSELARLRADCDFRVVQMRARAQLRSTTRVDAFFFANAKQKKRLMGAGETLIAKPWRHAVYLQRGPWPHPVLAHEIAHVVLGEVAPPPFRVAARWGGLWPQAALIEGAAVALSWELREGLTPHQWARLLQELGKLPPLSAFAGWRFIFKPAPQAYTIMGSFLRHVLQHQGHRTFLHLYQSAALQSLGSHKLAALERAWRRSLRHVAVPKEALALAKRRFAAPSVFAAVCPHHMAALRQQLGMALGQQHWQQALRQCDAIVAYRPGDPVATATRLHIRSRLGQARQAAQQLQQLAAQQRLPTATVTEALLRIGDGAWLHHNVTLARTLYERIADLPASEAIKRGAEARLLALRSPNPAARTPMLRYLQARQKANATGADALYLAMQLDRARPDGLGAYLVGRQLYGKQHYGLARTPLRQAEEKGLPPLMQRENTRLRAIAAFAMQQYDASLALWHQLGTLKADPAMAAQVVDWEERHAYHTQRP